MNFQKLNININKDEPSINDYLYCTSEFGEIPNKISIFNNYKIEDFIKFIDSIAIDRKISKEIIPGGSNQIVNQKTFIKVSDSIYLSFVEYDKNSDLASITDLVLYFKNGESDKVDSIIESLDKFIIDYEDHTNQERFNTIVLTPEGLHLEPIEILDSDYENMDLYYNDDVLKKSKKLIKTFKSNKKGLSIFYGERGTGKTTLLIDILSKIDKVSIFVPSSMIDIISTNEFRMLLKRYKDSVIIIDDCEIFFSHTYTKSNILTNNVIQMIDGACSDMNNIHIVCIFNTENINHIDPILLESNNYLQSIEILRLEDNKVEELCKHLSIKNKFSEPRVVDIVRNNHSQDSKLEMGF